MLPIIEESLEVYIERYCTRFRREKENECRDSITDMLNFLKELPCVVDEMAQFRMKRRIALSKAKRYYSLALVSDLTTMIRRARPYVIVLASFPNITLLISFIVSKIRS